MKDEKGHGSEAHGVAGAVAKAFVKPGTTAMHPELGRVTIVKVNNDGSAVVRDSTGVQGTTMVRGLSQDSGGQSVASNAHAAATLASGAKSAPVDTHPAMSGGPRNAQGYRTTGTAYEGPREVPTQSRDRSAAHNAGPNGLVRSNKPYRGIGS